MRNTSNTQEPAVEEAEQVEAASPATQADAAVLTDRQLIENHEQLTRRALLAEPKQEVYIPSDSAMALRSDYIDHVQVQLNGVSVFVPYGEQAKVPESIAQIINDALAGQKKVDERMAAGWKKPGRPIPVLGKLS